MPAAKRAVVPEREGAEGAHVLCNAASGNLFRRMNVRTLPSASCETMQGMDAEERSELERLRRGHTDRMPTSPTTRPRGRGCVNWKRTTGRAGPKRPRVLAAAETEPPDAGVEDDAEERDADGDRTASRRPR